MKYGFIFILVLVISFGSTCFGAIRMSYNYLGISTPVSCCANHGGVAYRKYPSGYYVCEDSVVTMSCK